MAWGTIIAILSTGVVTSAATVILTHILADWRERRKEKKGATDLGVRVAVHLERFAVQCADNVASDRYDHDSSGDFTCTELPLFHGYGADTDWKLLDSDLAARTLTFPNEVLLVKQMLSGRGDMDPPEFMEYTQKRVLSCGLHAWQMASDIRDRYALPKFNPKHLAWDMVKLLKEATTK